MKNDEWYFAYGSNLCVEQKKERTGPIRAARRCRLPGYRLAFNKKGTSGEVYANIVPESTEEVWGVIYRCNPDTFRKMDCYEGVPAGHYHHRTVEVVTEGGEVLAAITYVAGRDHVCQESPPSDRYLNKILRGAKDHRLPANYIRSIEIRAGRRSCPHHKRVWRSFCVDENLKNEWLASLNDLQCFDLISICEGHPSERKSSLRSMPHINFRAKGQLTGFLADNWSGLRPEIQDLLARLWREDTVVQVELRRRVCSSGRGRQEDVVIRVSLRRPHKSEQRENPETQWFEESVNSIKQMDVTFSQMLAAKREHPLEN